MLSVSEISVVSFILSGLVAGVPYQTATDARVMRRQDAASNGIVMSTVNDAWSQLQVMGRKDADLEGGFTQAVATQLGRLFPQQNIAIYHNKNSIKAFDSGAVYAHKEIPISSGTHGYEIWVLNSGTFQLAGDGGYQNWCVSGLFNLDGDSGHYVTFLNNDVSRRSISRRTVTDSMLEALALNKGIQPSDTPIVKRSCGSVVSAPSKPLIPPLTPVRLNPSNKDGNYFVNCKNRVTGVVSSGIAFYWNLNPGNNVGQQPDDYVDVSQGWYINWKQPGQVTFPTTGTTVHWTVFGNTMVNVDQTAGYADNCYEHFWMYKDAGNWLYSVDDWDCNSQYWAF